MNVHALGEQMVWARITPGASGTELAAAVQQLMEHRPPRLGKDSTETKLTLRALSVSGGSDSSVGFITVIDMGLIEPVTAIAEICFHPYLEEVAAAQAWESRHMGQFHRKVKREKHAAHVTYQSAPGENGLSLTVKFRASSPHADLLLLADSEQLMNDLALKVGV